uniref:Uncharacterized protein n=1 Tax=Candidatus Kentrum sp. LFY TaxID=2126342 RepID=A0A450V418_9GAMM|nr:MAG: hypothetical protein BECKLFY1418A_GA0070994_11012 [Candidatus Kentron sp. LFY]
MFVVGRRVLAMVMSQKFTGNFCHPWHLGPGIPCRDDGSGKFLHNRLKQSLSSSRRGMSGPRRQGRQQDLVAASGRAKHDPVSVKQNRRFVNGDSFAKMSGK